MRCFMVCLPRGCVGEGSMIEEGWGVTIAGEGVVLCATRYNS